MKRIVSGIMLAALVLLGAGCGTVNMPQGGVMPGALYGEGIYPSMKDSYTEFEFGSDDVEILGTVTGESESFNVLMLFSQGDNGYQKLLMEAKQKYPGTEALINFYWDTKYFNIGWPYPTIPVYQKAVSSVTATAVKFRKK